MWKAPRKEDDPDLPPLPAEVRELRCAKDWKLSPSQFRCLPTDDRALMLAEMMFSATCESYAHHFREKHARKPDEKKNPYSAILQEMGLPDWKRKKDVSNG